MMQDQDTRCAERRCDRPAEDTAERTYRLPSGRLATLRIRVCRVCKPKADAKLAEMVRRFETRGVR
jgi:hypothetical protein